MPKKLTIEDVKKYVQENSECELISTKYFGYKSNLKFKCKCGNIFERTFDNFRRQPHCKICGYKLTSRKLGRTTIQFKQAVYNIVKDEYAVLGEYINANTPILIKHNICGAKYCVKPVKFLNAGHRCPNCSGGIVKTNEDFLKEVKELVGNEYTILDIYKNCHTKIKIRHNKCGHEFYMRPNDFINNNQRCPYCNESHGELQILGWLNKHNIKSIPQYKFSDCKYKRTLPFDFYLPKQNMCIEFDGIQHYKPFRFGSRNAMEANLKRIKYRDSIKNLYCKNHDIKLIRIPYWEFEDINNILKSIL